MTDLAILHHLVNVGEISLHLVLQLLQNANDLAARRDKTVERSTQERIHGHLADGRTDVALKEICSQQRPFTGQRLSP